jgi:hypothetical protein
VAQLNDLREHPTMGRSGGLNPPPVSTAEALLKVPAVAPCPAFGRVDKSRSGDHAVSDVRGLGGVDHSNDLQLDPAR